jgi:hypothetical protein
MQSRWLFLIYMLLFNSVAATYGQTSTAAPHDDTQVWSDIQFTVPLAKAVDEKGKAFDRVALLLTGTLRLGRNVTRPVDERGAVAVEFKFYPSFRAAPGLNLRFTPGYLYQAAQPSVGRKSYESRLTLAATVEHPWHDFKFTDRNLVERRFRNSQPNSTRYRNRFQLGHPVTLCKREFTLYAADEVFYDWSVNEWVRNRFTVGVSRKFSERYTGEFYYLRQNDGRSRPGDLNVVGTLLRIRLD